jgi:hypothetical protein
LVNAGDKRAINIGISRRERAPEARRSVQNMKTCCAPDILPLAKSHAQRDLTTCSKVIFVMRMYLISISADHERRTRARRLTHLGQSDGGEGGGCRGGEGRGGGGEGGGGGGGEGGGGGGGGGANRRISTFHGNPESQTVVGPSRITGLIATEMRIIHVTIIDASGSG